METNWTAAAAAALFPRCSLPEEEEEGRKLVMEPPLCGGLKLRCMRACVVKIKQCMRIYQFGERK